MILSHIKSYLKGLLLLTSLSFAASCTDDEQQASVGTNTYQMNFDVSLDSYDGATTRASKYTFVDGDRVYVLFHQGSSRVTGVAVYNTGTGSWTLTASSSLNEVEQSTCQLAFFTDPGGATSTVVTLTGQTGTYTDAEATYALSGMLLTVQGRLKPVMGRIRFKGTSGQQGTFSGLAMGSTFDLSKHELTTKAAKCTFTCNSDGYTSYYYATFADATARKLTFDVNETCGLSRGFGSGVLAAGSSGYITIPTLDSHLGWTLVNLDSQEEIATPTLGQVTATDITAHKATVSSSLLSNGNGKVSDAGFVWSKTANPTVSDSKMSCGTVQTAFTATLNDLEELTTYHVRAYATNEAGTAYSQDFTFTTLEGNPLPTLTATTISDITSSEAKATSSITDSGKGSLTDAGFCYSAVQNPTISNNKVSCGTQTTTFSAKLTGLNSSTTYYVRAYATNANGTAYGEETSFTTRPDMVSRGLQAYYTFDNETADNAYQDNYHGFLNGGSYIADTPNGEGRALSLQSQQFVNIGYNPLSDCAAWSVSMWLKDWGAGTVFAAINGTTSRYGCPSFGFNDDGVVIVGKRTYSVGNLGIASVSWSSYQQSQWTHLVAIGNGKIFTVFLNGRKIDTIEYSGGYAGLGNSMVIGGRAIILNSGNYPLAKWANPMKVDNVRVHNVALTEAEVKQIYDYEK